MIITYSEFASAALVIQHAMRLRPIVICGLPRFTLFFHIISEIARFSKKQILNLKRLFRNSLQLLSEMLFVLRRTKRDMIENVYWPSCKVAFILVRF